MKVLTALRRSKFWHFALTNPRMRLGLALVGFWVVAGLLAPVVAPYSPVQPHPNDILIPPGPKYWLGTDKDGFDIFSRLVWAPRIDLGIALASTTIALVIGVSIGTFAGFFAGRRGVFGLLSSFVMRVVDVSLAFPLFVFALALVGILGAQLINVIIALTFVGSPPFVWLTRSQVLSVRQATFVEAARCSGNSELRVAFRHVLPNSLAAPLAQLSVILGGAILTTAGLSFIGAGVRIPTPEWGLMISEGASGLITGQWWPGVFPGLAIATCVLGFGLVGDGLRVYLDPKQRRQVGSLVQVEAAMKAMVGDPAANAAGSSELTSADSSLLGG